MQPFINSGQSGTEIFGSIFSGRSDQSFGWCQHKSWPVLSQCSRIPALSFFTSSICWSLFNCCRSSSIGKTYDYFWPVSKLKYSKNLNTIGMKTKLSLNVNNCNTFNVFLLNKCSKIFVIINLQGMVTNPAKFD